MGKAVESFWVALEEVINRWSGFDRALRKPDHEAFEELICTFRSYASELSNATNPTAFEAMVLSLAIGQQKRIRDLEQKLKAMQPDSAAALSVQEAKETIPIEPKTVILKATRGGEQTRLN
jgi:hypothetical protein